MLQFKSQHFLTGEELSKAELFSLIEGAGWLAKHRSDYEATPLKGKTIALMFEKPSLRTRVSFTIGIQEMGGQVIELLGSQMKQEEPEDFIRVLQGMAHGLMLRTFEHRTLERMIQVSTIPIINGLSNTHHPCQALADLLTVYQRFGHLKGTRIAYLGDGNNVLNSLLLLAPFLGVDVHYACPEGFQPDSQILLRAERRAIKGGGSIKSFADAESAVDGAHAVYTDVWTSMGFENDGQNRAEAFQPYQLNGELFAKARPDAIAMHCLPMVRGQEITEEVIEHPRSALFQQAENRLHAQKALILGLFRTKQKFARKEIEYSHVV